MQQGTIRFTLGTIDDSVGQYSDFTPDSEAELYAARRQERTERQFDLTRDLDPLYTTDRQDQWYGWVDESSAIVGHGLAYKLKDMWSDIYDTKRGQDAFFLGLDSNYMDEIVEEEMPAEMMENTL